MKDKLTDRELSFLARHGLGPEDVMDVRGLSQGLWKREIREQGKTIALGTECSKAGHRLRSRSGHCVQCDVSKLAFQWRHSAEQWVYIAGSMTKELIKIGTCGHCGQREHQLRAESYGGVDDWLIIYWVKARNAGAVEHAARSRLRKYAVSRPYWKDNAQQMGTELLKCSFSRALDALTAAIGDAQLGEPWKYRWAGFYDFTEPDKM